MFWRGRRQSDNVEDVRGKRAVRVGIRGRLGTLVLVVIYALMGGDVNQLLDMLPKQASVPDQGLATPYQESSDEAQLREFVSVVLA